MSEVRIASEQQLFLSPHKTMEIVLETIQEIIPYELAVIMSKESDNTLRVRFARGSLATEALKQYEISLQKRPDLAEALRSGTVRLVEETADPNHHDTYEGIIDLPLGHSCMLAPLSLGGTPLGLMTLDHTQCDIFTPERVRIANSLSKLITLALAQAIATDSLLHEKEALLVERTSFLDDISTFVGGLVGASPSWLRILEKIKLVAPTDSNVMILGETGTGKEQVAKAIHALSKRAGSPFITLNCSALNANLAESELFGHEKGAFTGAIGSRRGRFELADGGTLFLDEVGDLPLEIQPKFLRAIQEGTFERLGSEKTLRANVRILCATHVDLQSKIKEGKFREDLYYRLNVFPITLPPLRERRGDIDLLAEYFLKRLAAKFENKTFFLSPEAREILRQRPWYGNVRELHNTLERAAILCSDGRITPQHLVFEDEYAPSSALSEPIRQLRSFDEEVRRIIEEALVLTKGKIYGKDGAAALLKMKPTTLQSKMRKLNIRV